MRKMILLQNYQNVPKHALKYTDEGLYQIWILMYNLYSGTIPMVTKKKAKSTTPLRF